MKRKEPKVPAIIMASLIPAPGELKRTSSTEFEFVERHKSPQSGRMGYHMPSVQEVPVEVQQLCLDLCEDPCVEGHLLLLLSPPRLIFLCPRPRVSLPEVIQLTIHA